MPAVGLSWVTECLSDQSNEVETVASNESSFSMHGLEDKRLRFKRVTGRVRFFCLLSGWFELGVVCGLASHVSEASDLSTLEAQEGKAFKWIVHLWWRSNFLNASITDQALWFVKLQEGFAFIHCTTCKAPYYIRVQVPADRRWRTIKFRFFVTRDILVIFAAVQLVHIFRFLHC